MLKKFLKVSLVASIATLFLTTPAQAGIFSNDDQSAPTNGLVLPKAPHNIDWYLRHGYSLATNVSIGTAAGTATRSVIDETTLLLINKPNSPDSIIECRIEYSVNSYCYVLTDPSFKNGEPVQSEKQTNDD